MWQPRLLGDGCFQPGGSSLLPQVEGEGTCFVQLSAPADRCRGSKARSGGCASLSVRTDRPWPADNLGRAFPRDGVVCRGYRRGMAVFLRHPRRKKCRKTSTRSCLASSPQRIVVWPVYGAPWRWCCSITSVLLLRAPFPVAWLWARVRDRLATAQEESSHILQRRLSIRSVQWRKVGSNGLLLSR